MTQIYQLRDICREKGCVWHVSSDGDGDMICARCRRWEMNRSWLDPFHPRKGQIQHAPSEKPRRWKRSTHSQLQRLFSREYGLPAPPLDETEVARNAAIVAVLHARLAS